MVVQEAAPAGEYVPAGHISHGLVPPVEKVPAAHGWHTLEVDAAAVDELKKVPAGQGVHVEELCAAIALEYVPIGHSVQVAVP